MLSRGRDNICSVIRGGPGVRSIREAPVCKVIDYPLIRVLLGAHENETELTMSGGRARVGRDLTVRVYADIRYR